MKNITKDALRTADARFFYLSDHVIDRCRRRGISGEDILDAARTGTIVRTKDTEYGPTLGANKGSLRVIFGRHPASPAMIVVVTAYHDDAKTGLCGGYNPAALAMA